MVEKKSKQEENNIEATEEAKVQVDESKDIHEEKEQEDEVASKKKSSAKSKKERKDALKELESRIAEISDKHLRLQAEFDNFRRRTLKEKFELIKSAGESVLVNLLPVIDDFDRALESLKDLDNEEPSKLGLLLINTKFQEFLKQNGVKEIEAINQDFNCDLHEAITKIPAPTEDLKGKNIDVVQKGYTLGEKVIRFAKVVIGE